MVVLNGGARLPSQASSAWRVMGAAAAAFLLLAATSALLGVVGGGWQAALQRGGLGTTTRGCPVQMCPPCAGGSQGKSSEADTILVDTEEQALAAEGCPPPPDCPATAEECPPLPDCPALEPQQCPECPAMPGDEALQGEQQRQQRQQLKRRKKQAGRGGGPRPSGTEAAAVAEGGNAASESSSSGASASADNSTGEDVPLLCGGPAGVPRVTDALDAATRAIEAGVTVSFAQWKDTGFTLEDLLATADGLQAYGTHDTMMWVEVHGGKVSFPRRVGGHCDWFCNEWILPLRESWERGIQEGKLRVPEGVPFLWNVFDHPGCREKMPGSGESSCRAPLLSIIQHANTHDLPVPPFGRKFEPVFVPWAEKSDLAFFRGTPWCATHGLNGTVVLPGANCSRESLPLLSLEHPDLLNVSLIRPYGRAPGREGPKATHEEHGLYKYLLQLDGITASRRLATLLSMNSLVLKQESPYSEWYYHALKPCVHYLPFWQYSETDVLDLLRTLRGNPANELVAQRIAANGQAFAAAWLDEDGQLRYWQMVIDQYAKLYHGSTNPATLAAKKRGEKLGQQASAAGREAEMACFQNNQPECWAVGRDAALAAYRELAEKELAAAKAATGDGNMRSQAELAADEAAAAAGAEAGRGQEGATRRALAAYVEADAEVDAAARQP